MPAANLDLLIEQGTTFEHQLTWKDSNGTPVDLTGYSARMQIREKVTSETYLLELTTQNNRISLGGTEGTITLEIDEPDTRAITWKKGVYDLELISSTNKVTRLVQGKVTVSPEVTR